MGLYQNMQVEPLSELALREPIVVSPSITVRDAVLKMRGSNLGCVIAVDEQQKPVGMFTESMLTQLLVTDPAGLNEPLKAHLSTHWPWVKQTDKIVDVLEAMQMKNIRFLCVVDEEGRLVGLTGQKGLMEYVAEHFPGQVMVQRIGGSPYPSQKEGA